MHVHLPATAARKDQGVMIDYVPRDVEKEAMLVAAQAIHSIVRSTEKAIESWEGRAGWEEMLTYIPSGMASATGAVKNKSVNDSSREIVDSESLGNSYEVEVAYLKAINLEREKTKLTKEVELLHKEVVEKDMKVNETEGAVATLSERMESLQLEVKQKSDAISKLEHERQNESIKMEMEKQETDRIRNEVSVLKMEMEMLRQAGVEKDSEVDETKTAMGKLSVEMEKEKLETVRLREKVAEYEKKIEVFERKDTKNVSEIGDLRDKVKELVETETNLTNEITTVKAELECTKVTHTECHNLMLQRSVELKMELDKLKEKICRYEHDEVVVVVRASDKDGETIDACVTKCDKYTKMAELKERMLVFEGESLPDILIKTTPYGTVDFKINRADLETFHHYFGSKGNSQHLKRTVSDE